MMRRGAHSDSGLLRAHQNGSAIRAEDDLVVWRIPGCLQVAARQCHGAGATGARAEKRRPVSVTDDAALLVQRSQVFRKLRGYGLAVTTQFSELAANVNQGCVASGLGLGDDCGQTDARHVGLRDSGLALLQAFHHRDLDLLEIEEPLLQCREFCLKRLHVLDRRRLLKPFIVASDALLDNLDIGFGAAELDTYVLQLSITRGERHPYRVGLFRQRGEFGMLGQRLRLVLYLLNLRVERLKPQQFLLVRWGGFHCFLLSHLLSLGEAVRLLHDDEIPWICSQFADAYAHAGKRFAELLGGGVEPDPFAGPV